MTLWSWGVPRARAAIALSTAWFRPRCRGYRASIPMWWWITRPGWSISAAASSLYGESYSGWGDCSRRGVQAAGRIARLMEEMQLHPQTVGLIVNRVPGGVLDEGTQEEIQRQGLRLLSALSLDDTIYRYDCDGRPLTRCRQIRRYVRRWPVL